MRGDAIDEVLAFLKQRLSKADIRDGQVTMAIVVLKFTKSIRILGSLDALVINLYFPSVSISL